MQDVINPIHLNIKNTSMGVFDESQKYINGKRIFFAYHEIFPSFIYFRNISTEKTIKWVESDLKDQILQKHYNSSSLHKNHKNGIINVIYILFNEIILDVEDDGVVTLLFSEKSEQAALIIQKQIEKFRLRRNSATVWNLRFLTQHNGTCRSAEVRREILPRPRSRRRILRARRSGR